MSSERTGLLPRTRKCWEEFTVACSDLRKNSFSVWLNQLEGESFQFWSLCIFSCYVIEMFLISNLIASGTSFSDLYSTEYLANNVIALAVGIASTGYLAGSHPSEVEFTIIMKVLSVVANLGAVIFLLAFAAVVWSDHAQAIASYFLLCLILIGSILIFIKVIMYEIWWFYHHPYRYGVFLSYRKQKKCDPVFFSNHVQTDEMIAKGIKELLEFCGIRVFMDQTELPLGQFWFDGLQKGISSSFLFVPFLSSSAQKNSFENLENQPKVIDYVAWEHLMALQLCNTNRIQGILPVYIGRTKNDYVAWDANQAPTNLDIESEVIQRKVKDSLQQLQYNTPSNFSVSPIFKEKGIDWIKLREQKQVSTIEHTFFGALAIVAKFCELNNPSSIFNPDRNYVIGSSDGTRSLGWYETMKKQMVEYSLSIVNRFFNCLACFALERCCQNDLSTIWYMLLEWCDTHHFGICYLNFILLFSQLLVASILVADGNDDLFNNLNEFSTFLSSLSVALGISGYLAGSTPIFIWKAIRFFASIVLMILCTIILSNGIEYWKNENGDSITTFNFGLAVANVVLSILSSLKSIHDASILPTNYKYGVYLSFRRNNDEEKHPDERIGEYIKTILEYFGIRVYVVDKETSNDELLKKHAEALAESILYIPIISKEGQKVRFEALHETQQFDMLLWEYFMAKRLRESNRLFGIVPIFIARKKGDEYDDFFEKMQTYGYNSGRPDDIIINDVMEKVKSQLLALKVSPYIFQDAYKIGKSLDLISNQGLEWNKLVEFSEEKAVPVEYLAVMSIMKALAAATKFESFSHRHIVQPVNINPQHFKTS